VLQDVFMQLWRKPEAFDANRGSLAAWLAVIARHRAIDALRKRKPATDISEVVIALDLDLEAEAGRKIAIAKVRAALAAMPAEQRKAVELAFFEGLTHSEVAAKTGEPLGTVKTRIRSALQSLRKVFSS
jgi:RNA polymerase sigma-70 factor, ECF subfamily